MKKSDYEKLPKEERIFGYDADTLAKVIEQYCKAGDELPKDQPLSNQPFWDSLHEGCEKLAKEDKDIIRLI